MDAAPAPSFHMLGDMPPASPVIVSVPHAGRMYSQALTSALRVPFAAVLPLEDRHVDSVAITARGVETMIVQQVPRAWIDLNRGEDDRDPRVDEGAPLHGPLPSAKVRAGLGLVPRRVTGGDLWQRRFTDAEIAERIVRHHRPFHAALDAALKAARTRFGIAVLLDLHSMPRLGHAGPTIVIGDLFGRSADPRFVARLEEEARIAGHATALNTPYAGGHILARHARPAEGIHAIQLEIDRSCYLDARLDGIGRGHAATVALVRAMLAALANEALLPLPMAAE